MTLNPNKAGLAFGGLLGLFHFVWSLLVLLGLAQPFISFIFQLHMIVPPYTIAPFSLLMALGLIIITSLIGYIFGWVFAKIWNYVQK